MRSSRPAHSTVRTRSSSTSERYVATAAADRSSRRTRTNDSPRALGTTTASAHSSSATGTSPTSTSRSPRGRIRSSYAATVKRWGRTPSRTSTGTSPRAVDRDRVEPGRPQPDLGPAPHVAVGGVVEGRQEVGQGGVPEPVPGQVLVEPGQEGLVAEPGRQLAEHRVALGVGDRVEVGQRGVDVGHLLGERGDRMGGAALVGDVRLRLAADLVARLGADEAGPVVGDPVAEVVGERLLEPGVLEPAHRHQVAEPHVGLLVGDDGGAEAAQVVAGALARQHLVPVGDAARVLLGAPVEPRHEDLVARVERVGLGEQRGQVVEDGVGGAAQLVGVAVEVRGQRPAGVPAARQPVVVPGDGVPRAGAHDEQRDRHRRGGRELPVALAVGRRPAVAEDGPGGVGRHGQRDRALQVVLVEAREDPVGDVHAAVGRHVGLAVGRVGEDVHAVAVRDVGQPGLDGHLGDHPRREAGQGDPARVVRRRDRGAVDDDAYLGGVGQLEEGALRPGREPHGAP